MKTHIAAETSISTLCIPFCLLWSQYPLENSWNKPTPEVFFSLENASFINWWWVREQSERLAVSHRRNCSCWWEREGQGRLHRLTRARGRPGQARPRATGHGQRWERLGLATGRERQSSANKIECSCQMRKGKSVNSLQCRVMQTVTLCDTGQRGFIYHLACWEHPCEWGIVWPPPALLPNTCTYSGFDSLTEYWSLKQNYRFPTMLNFN